MPNKGEQVEINLKKKRTQKKECCIALMPQRKRRVLLKVGGILFIAVCEGNTTCESNGITEQSGDQTLKRRLNGECSVPIGQAGGQGSMYRSAAGITQINHLLTFQNPHSFGATTVKTPQLLQLDVPITLCKLQQ